ncbi:EAL domain-containing response regulator [Paraneptunicella aestuarii]|uniref:EAL domain-containing response regulator n=1 Tax=Paraneptunicella aestuarii TaxID=2831148 RepID=UPI001E283219|nr:EAL domain-containing response regulator [Paraneptunicella aestuarii]UAA40577.1 EAL domain-containing response regulator [Paraneptunicella aestuarii]
MVDVSCKRVLLLGNLDDSIGLVENYFEGTGIQCHRLLQPDTEWMNIDDGYDAFVLGLDMPGIDGVAMLERLAKREIGNPVILMSRMDDVLLESTIRLAKREGLNVAGVLKHPAIEQDFCALMQDVFKTQKSKSQHTSSQDENDNSSLNSPIDYKQALNNGHFYLVYQPQVDLENKLVVGVECLSRLSLPEVGDVEPRKFISEMEHSGMISEFTLVAISQALNELKNIARRIADFKISFNISVLSLSEAFFDELCHLVSESGLETHNLVLEVSESSILSLNKHFEKVLIKLRLAGFSLMVDGFGSGLSTLRKMRDLPFSEIKINRKLVNDIGAKKNVESIVSAMIELAQNLSYRIVCEGVEDVKQLTFLQGLKCNVFQGNLLAKPISYYELRSFIYDVANQVDTICLDNTPNNVAERINSADIDVVWVSQNKQVNHRLVTELKNNLTRFQHIQMEQIDRYQFTHKELLILDETLSLGDITRIIKLSPDSNMLVMYDKFQSRQPITLFELGIMEVIESRVLPLELMHRLIRLIEYSNKIRQIDNANKSSSEMAMEAMKQAAQYGSILDFFKETITIRCHKKLKQKTARFFESMGYHVVVTLFDHDYMHIKMSGLDGCPELVRRVVSLLRERGKVYQYDNRLVFNGKVSSILILNAPKDEFECGRIKDVGAAVVDLLDEKWNQVQEQRALTRISEQLRSILSTSVVDLKEKSSCALESFAQQISQSFHILDLSEEQENFLVNMVKQVMSSMSCEAELQALASRVHEIQNVADEHVGRY